MSTPSPPPAPPARPAPFYGIGACLRPPPLAPSDEVAEYALHRLAPLAPAADGDYASDMTTVLTPPAADIIRTAIASSLPASDERRDRMAAVARTMLETALRRAHAARSRAALGAAHARRDLISWRTEARAEAALYDLYAAAGRGDDAADAAARALALLRARGRPAARGAAADVTEAEVTGEEWAAAGRRARAAGAGMTDDALRAGLCTAVAVRVMAGDGTPRERAARALPVLEESLALRRGRIGAGAVDTASEGMAAAARVRSVTSLGAAGDVGGDEELHGWMVTMRLLADARADLGNLVGAYECCASLLRYLGGKRLAWAAGRRFVESWDAMAETDSDEEGAEMRRRQRRDRRRDRRRLAEQQASSGSGAVNGPPHVAFQEGNLPAAIVIGGASSVSGSEASSSGTTTSWSNSGSDNSDGSGRSRVSTESKKRLAIQEREVKLRGWREEKARRHRSQLQYRMALLVLQFNMYGLEVHTCAVASGCICNEMTPDKALAFLEMSCEAVSVRANPQMCWSSVEAVKGLVLYVSGLRQEDASLVEKCIFVLEVAQKFYPRAWKEDAFGVAEIRFAIVRARRLLANLQRTGTGATASPTLLPPGSGKHALASGET